MSQARNPFHEALSAHDGRSLKDAFDRANERAERRLHRTTLTRWLDGSVPNNEDFVRLLAQELDDEDILDAWQTSRGTRSSAAHRAVVSRFDGLSPEDQEQAYYEIRRSYLASRFPRLLDHLRYRVEVNDPPDPSAEHLMIRFTEEYDSSLPARAQVVFVPSHRKLSEAYENPLCIFRDRVALEPNELDRLLEAGPAPVLAYNQIDRAGQRMITHEGQWQGEGVFEFDNDEVDSARIRLSIDYPWPRSVQVFPIKFGEFRVAGGAEFTLVLNARSASSPGAFAYPPAGRQREWAVDRVRPTELVASLGAGGTILADGDGLVLSWVENH